MRNREDLIRPLPRRGQRFRHFKGGIYQVVSLAKHTESNEILVVYKPDEAENKRRIRDEYARPIGMFMSKVDKEKYPDCQQIYRFELIV